jgi:predicted lipoprotein
VITEKNDLMRTVLRLIILALVLSGVCCLFPLFHVVPLQKAVAEARAKTFDPVQFAAEFWTNRLLPSLDQAVPAQILLAAIQADPATAKKQFSRSVGMDESYYYFLRGDGKVVSISDDAVSLAVSKDSTNAEIAIQTGLVFGDAIRDGTGLLNVNDYPDSQDFNDISAALDNIVDTNVIPALTSQARIGSTVSFAGCAEVDDESTDLKPLKLIPIQARVQ